MPRTRPTQQGLHRCRATGERRPLRLVGEPQLAPLGGEAEVGEQREVARGERAVAAVPPGVGPPGDDRLPSGEGGAAHELGEVVAVLRDDGETDVGAEGDLDLADHVAPGADPGDERVGELCASGVGVGAAAERLDDDKVVAVDAGDPCRRWQHLAEIFDGASEEFGTGLVAERFAGLPDTAQGDRGDDELLVRSTVDEVLQSEAVGQTGVRVGRAAAAGSAGEHRHRERRGERRNDGGDGNDDAEAHTAVDGDGDGDLDGRHGLMDEDVTGPHEQGEEHADGAEEQDRADRQLDTVQRPHARRRTGGGEERKQVAVALAQVLGAQKAEDEHDAGDADDEHRPDAQIDRRQGEQRHGEQGEREEDAGHREGAEQFERRAEGDPRADLGEQARAPGSVRVRPRAAHPTVRVSPPMPAAPQMALVAAPAHPLFIGGADQLVKRPPEISHYPPPVPGPRRLVVTSRDITLAQGGDAPGDGHPTGPSVAKETAVGGVDDHELGVPAGLLLAGDVLLAHAHRHRGVLAAVDEHDRDRAGDALRGRAGGIALRSFFGSATEEPGDRVAADAASFRLGQVGDGRKSDRPPNGDGAAGPSGGPQRQRAAGRVAAQDDAGEVHAVADRLG